MKKLILSAALALFALPAMAEVSDPSEIGNYEGREWFADRVNAHCADGTTVDATMLQRERIAYAVAAGDACELADPNRLIYELEAGLDPKVLGEAMHGVQVLFPGIAVRPHLNPRDRETRTEVETSTETVEGWFWVKWHGHWFPVWDEREITVTTETQVDYNGRPASGDRY